MIIYSANIGGYDTFKEPLYVNPKARYMLFTDQDYQSDVWEVIKVNDKRHPRTIARDIKINAHKWLPKHNISVWVDHSFRPAQIPNFELPPNSVMCFAHNDRKCIYSEIAELLRLGHTTTEKADKLINMLVDNNYPQDNGLSSSGFMVRSNTERFNRKWWKLLKYCERDQATQHFAARTTGTIILRPNAVTNVYINPYIAGRERHLKSSIIQR